MGDHLSAETKLQTDDLMDLLAPPRHTDGPRRVVSGHHRTMLVPGQGESQGPPRKGPRRGPRRGSKAKMLPIVSSISLFPSFRPLVGADFPGAEDENGNR